MCGILGVVSPVCGERDIEKAIDTFRYRGKDSQGIFNDRTLWLGHVRLSILDVSENGRQPMVSDCGRYVVVYNGEIYNHHDIRKKLEAQNVHFRSQSDTETLLLAYRQFGQDMLGMLNGMFAFAIYDRAQKTIFIARDRFGIKPLYYYLKDGDFVFSSEIKSMSRLPFFDKTVNYNAFLQTLVLQWPLPGVTGFKHVQQLLPGHCMTLSVENPEGSIVTRKWTQALYQDVCQQYSGKQWKEKLENAMINAVKRQQLADVPTGFFLSGGLDSSLIVAIAAKHSNNTLPQLNCFTANTNHQFINEGFEDDYTYALKVAGILKVKIHTITLGGDILHDFDDMIWHLDTPQADLAPLLVSGIARRAAETGCKVLLGGVGGDDIFTGYRRHQAVAFDPLIDKIPLGVRDAFYQVSKLIPGTSPFKRRWKKMAENLRLNGEERLIGYFKWMQTEKALQLFSSDMREQLDEQEISSVFSGLLSEIPGERSPVNKMLYLEQNTFMSSHNLNYLDKMAMKWGVEARVPYLDNEIVELSSAMPARYKLRGTSTKYILREIAEKYLPDQITYRSKTGFGFPIRQLLVNDDRAWNEIKQRIHFLLDDNKGVFDRAPIRQMISSQRDGRGDYIYNILSLLAIESWIRQFT